MTGDLALSGADVTFGDNDKAIFGGTTSELQIYSDGSDSRIHDAGTGVLLIQTDGTGVQIKSDGSESIADFNKNGGVNLYYDQGTYSAAKLATTSTGVDITGTLTSDGLDTSQAAKINSNTAEGVQLGGDATGSTLIGNLKNTSGRFTLQAPTSRSVVTQTNGAIDRMLVASNGDISFYEDTGTTPKFFWDASDQDLTITPNLGNISIKKGVYDATNSVRLEAGGTTSTYLEYRGYLGHIWDVNTTERMRIDSSGNVGIGTGSPSPNKLAVNGDQVLLSNGALKFADAGNSHVGLIKNSGASGTGQLDFHTGPTPTERMRIDSSGNLLVGKTAATISTDGAELRPTGEVVATTNGLNVAYFNRRSSDGSIAEFRKDGTTVGSIGSRAGVVSTLILDPRTPTSSTGAGLGTTSAKIVPADTSGLTDAKSDLGDTNNRFKDLYLSGGVYLGGTGAANKLDDYEEGTWTPVVGGVSQSANGAWYTKIGRFIMLSADFTISGAPSTNYRDISGLPFSAGVNYSGIVTFGYNTDNSATMSGLVNNTGSISLYAGGTNRPDLNNGDRVIFAAYYQTA
jgi:hypothetical protein